MLRQRLASCPPYEPGRGRRVAHQCPGVRTPLLREPRSPEGNGKGSRKEEMGEERGSRGEQHLCSLVPSAVEVFFSWPPGHWPASSPVSLWGTLPFTHHSAIKLCAFPQFYLWLFPLSVPLSKILLPSSPFRPQVITHLGRVTFPMTSLPKVLPPCFLYTFHHIPGSVVCLFSYLVPKWSPSHCPHWSMSSLRREIWLSCSALCPAGIGCLDKRMIITQFPPTSLPSVPCLFIFIPMTVVLAHPFPFRLTQLLPKKITLPFSLAPPTC